MIDFAGRLPLSLGKVVATPDALTALNKAGVSSLTLLARHASGDWGDVEDEDKEANDKSVINHDRVMSLYKLSTGDRAWVITEADRSSTCLLLPSEY